MTNTYQECLRGFSGVVVLKMLERGESYSYELARSIRDETGGVVSMGRSTLYPLLRILTDSGYVKQSETIVSGRVRKYYSLTTRGHQYLASESDKWTAIASSLKALGIIFL